MNSYTIVIPSKTIGNLRACIDALRAAGESAHIIVVDDGLDWNGLECRGLLIDWAREQNVSVVRGMQPFVFARNTNNGIRFAGLDDIVLMNDDAILRTPQGLQVLATQAYANQEYGAICPGFDHVGTPNLCNQGRRELTEEKVMLVFACVFIPRRTIDAVGLLDERFGVNAGGPGARGYGLEDDDYSLRIRNAGLKLGVYDPVRVDHTAENTGLASTFRHDAAHPVDVLVHERLFQKKWGVHPRLQK